VHHILVQWVYEGQTFVKAVLGGKRGLKFEKVFKVWMAFYGDSVLGSLIG